ncbi:MAG TPA: hypothetical protein VFP92_11610 [Rhodanobacteraceae bacterium]|nr:hypothetical protein [Rhodanobacteraceae bacterium]
MDTIPANLCTLIEQLEDARRFHGCAARQSAGEARERHRARSLAYAAMVSEIRKWAFRNNESDAPQSPAASANAPGRSDHEESYAALLERVYRMHRAVAPVARAIRMRAAGDAMDGEARDGRRRAGAA